MPYLIIGLVSLLTVVALFVWSGRAAADASGIGRPDAGVAATSQGKKPGPKPAVASRMGAARAALAERLKALAVAPRPPRHTVSAECYEPPQEYRRAEYICPRDGERTVYAIDGKPPADSMTIRFFGEEVPALRSLVASIKGVDVSLDESALCRKCTPTTGEPSLEVALIIRFAGEEPRRVRDITPGKLQLLVEFFSGTGVHNLRGPDTEPLANHAGEIADLLGLPRPPDTAEPTKPTRR